MDSRFEHLGLRDWPFQTVPDERFYAIWADRSEVRDTIDRLLTRWDRYDRSTLHLMWADFGAGKTHALQHMKSRCRSEGRRTLCVYAAFPKTVKSFVDVYREAMLGVDFESLRPDLERAWQSQGGLAIIRRVSPRLRDFGYALKALVSGDLEQNFLATAWLCADGDVGKRDLRPLGISGPIRTTDEATEACAALVTTLTLSARYGRVAFLLDEFQRASACRPQVREDINAGLHALYNACPTSLTLVLSFSLGKPDNIKYLLTPELKSRAEDQDNIMLPPLSPEEANVFMADLVGSFASDDGPLRIEKVFTRDGVAQLVDSAARRGPILPRNLMKLGDAVLRAADDTYLGSGRLPTINAAYVKRTLADVRSIDDEGEAG